jgi:hypothetical protein
MSNYKVGKVYKIICLTSGLVYYGSTCAKLLSRRLACHRASYKYWKKGEKGGKISSYQVLENDNYEIELVELVTFINKMELLMRERSHIDNNECVNERPPLRTEIEKLEYYKNYYRNYRLVNGNSNINNVKKTREKKGGILDKEEKAKRKAEYYLKNRDKIIKQQAIYQLNNKENIAKRRADYYQKSVERESIL